MATETVTPQSFFSDTPPPRIIGTECEYNLQPGTINGAVVDRGKYISNEAIKAVGFAVMTSFLSNGASMSVDVGHLEYRTQECLGPRQAAAADLAGIVIVGSVVEASGLPHDGVYRITGSFLPDKKDETNGYHENYLIPRAIGRSDTLSRTLPSFLASRIWALNGTVRKNFVFSQKVWGIGDPPISRDYGRRTSYRSKPMVLIPPETSDNDILNGREWARIEVRHADAGQSPTARFLELGAMSLVLRMTEHAPLLGERRLSDLGILAPAASAKNFAEDLSLRAKARTRGGKRMTAMDIQEEFATIANELCREILLPDDERLAARLWLEVCERMKRSQPSAGEYDGLEHVLDIAAKHSYMLGHHEPDEMHIDNPEVAKRSLLWDRTLPMGVGQLWWLRHPSKIVTGDDIAHFVENPPLTRAAVRAKYLKHHRRDLSYVKWNEVTYKGHAKRLSDPYASV